MGRLYLSILVLFGWFFAFYNVERVNEQVNLASFVYLLAPVLGMLVLGISSLRRISVYWYIPLAVVCVVTLRAMAGYGPQENAFALMVTEILATWTTIALSYLLGKKIDEFHSAAATAIVSHATVRTIPYEEAQSAVVQEVRRARLFHRPIAMLALNPEAGEGENALDRFTQEFREKLIQQYISAQAAEYLSEHLRSCDILTQTKEHFLALLPELSREEALAIAAKMQEDVSRNLGIDLKVGISMFPEDEVTAFGLIERAESEEAEIESIRAAASVAMSNGDLHLEPNMAATLDSRQASQEATTVAQ